MNDVYDLIIIGMGPGGISSAIYAKRSNLKVLLLDSSAPGGILNNIDRIDNYPGIISISGADLATKLFDQISALDIPYVINRVVDVNIVDGFYKVTTNKEEYLTKKIIIASGRKSRKLGLDNEKRLLGRGVSNCAVCDGPFYKGKNVCVVGGGDSALQEAIYLASIVDKVYVINRNNDFRAREELVEQIKSLNNVEVILSDEVAEINGTDFLENIKLKSGKVLDISGLFVYIGYDPNIEYLENLDILENNGYIKVDDKYETKLHGVFAVGDIIKKDYYQIIMAMSEGATASLNAAKEIRHEK